MNKQPTAINNNDFMVNEEIYVSKVLTPGNYFKVDLKQITRDLTAAGQSQLLQVLKEHKTLFLGKWGDWKVRPVTIKVIEDATPA